MINYNAKDLIEQAQMLADLQNSDFISWKENIMFLDNAWTELYQQIINHGDKSFLKKFTFTGERSELPDDFYQLYYICYDDGFCKRPINRKSKTSTVDGPYYDIIENEIIIYNKLNNSRSFEIDYFPVRDSITFSAPDIELSTLTNTNVIDCSNKYVLCSVGDVYKVYDISNGVQIGSDYSGKNYIVLYDKVPLGNNETTQNIFFKVDNKVYIIDSTQNSEEKNLVKPNGDVVFSTKLPEGIGTDRINAFTDEGLFYTKEDGTVTHGIPNRKLYFYCFATDTESVYAENILNRNVICFNGRIYYETHEGLFCDDVKIYDTKDYDSYIGILKIDTNTGYGIMCKTVLDDLYLKSSFTNTELNFPSNVYYTYMAYKLAVYYKIKQAADPSGLVALADDALKTFYDTLPRDENEYVRIANAYAR